MTWCLQQSVDKPCQNGPSESTLPGVKWIWSDMIHSWPKTTNQPILSYWSNQFINHTKPIYCPSFSQDVSPNKFLQNLHFGFIYPHVFPHVCTHGFPFLSPTNLWVSGRIYIYTFTCCTSQHLDLNTRWWKHHYPGLFQNFKSSELLFQIYFK